MKYENVLKPQEIIMPEVYRNYILIRQMVLDKEKENPEVWAQVKKASDLYKNYPNKEN